MTLLESLIALVLLGLAAVGFLEAFQSASRSTTNAADWVQAVSYAEAAMEQTKLGSGDRAAASTLPPGFVRRIDVQPWSGAGDVARITITITHPGERTFVLNRLVRVR